MPQGPKITIVVNSFNYEKYVRQAIESVLDQDYDNKEVVIIDDGSRDLSPKIISEYADRATVLLRENRGQAVACLEAVTYATGEYIQFLDSDDYLAPGALTRIAELCKPGVVKVHFPLIPIDSDGEIIGPAFPRLGVQASDEIVQELNIRGCYTAAPNSGNVYRADIFSYIDKIDYEISIDGIIYLLAPFFGEIKKSEEPLGYYRYHTLNHSQHGILSSKRFRGEAARFLDRLDHLEAILGRLGNTKFKKRPASAYAFVWSRKILEEVADGRRPRFSAICAYWAALFREGADLRSKILFGGWATASLVVPDGLRRTLALYLTDPRYRRLRRERRAGATI